MNRNYEINLEGKVVTITGAGGYIGGCIARELAKAKCKIALLDLNEENAKIVENDVKNLGGYAKSYKCNVLSVQSIEKAHQEILQDIGKTDILINGAGGNNARATCDNEYASLTEVVDKDFFSLSEDGVRFVFDLNFLGTFLPTQVFAKDMMGRRCSILNISSMNAFTPLTKIPAYSAAKAGISNFTKWLAVHFAKVGIRVNAIAPGFFLSSQNRSLLYNDNGEPTARTTKIINATPMERLGEVRELMGGVKLLIDEENASFITGVVLPIDGGFSAYSGV